MKKKLGLLLSLAMVMSACSTDSSDSTTDTVTTFKISGNVIDPAITGARINMVYADNGTLANVCGSAGTAVCEDWSDDNGAFDFAVGINTDTSNLAIQSTGGKDVVTGSDFLGISMESLAIPSYSGLDTIIISPVTDIARDLLAKGTSTADIATMLGITADNITANPLSNSSVAKATYVITDFLTSDNNTTVANIVSNLTTSNTIFSDALVDALFTDATVATAKKALVASVTGQDFSNPESAVESLAMAEKVNLFIADAISSSMTSVPSDAASFSDNAKANIKALLEAIESQTATAITPTATATESVYNALVLDNSTYGDYATYDVATTAFVTTGVGASTTRVATVVKESVVAVSTSLSTLLAQDSTALSNYFFSSNIAPTYQAISLANKVLDDSVVTAIYTTVINTYSSYGLYELAYNYAQVFITDPTTRANVIRTIGVNMASYNNAGAIDMLKLSYALYESIASSVIASGIDVTDFIEAYATVGTSMYNIGDTTTANEVRTKVYALIDANLSASTSPTGYTVTARLISAPYILVGTYVDEKRYQDALTVYDDTFTVLEKLEEVATREGNTSSADMTYMGGMMYDLTSIYVYDESLRSEVLTRMQALYTKVQARVNANGNTGLNANFENMYPALYILGGRSTAGKTYADEQLNAMLAIVDSANPSSVIANNRNQMINDSYLMLSEQLAPLEGVSVVSSMLEDNFTISVGYNLNTPSVYTLVNAFTFFNGTNPGVSTTAMTRGNYTLAADALAYAGKQAMDNVNLFSSITLSPIILGATNVSNLGNYTYYINNTRVVYEYIKLAKLDTANAATYNTAAIAVLDNASNWLETKGTLASTPSLGLMHSYITLAELYSQVGDTAKSEAQFAKALAMGDGTITAENTLGYLDMAIAWMYVFKGDSANAKTYLANATTYATNHASSSVTAASVSTTMYGYIMELYSKLGDTTTIKDILALAENSITNSTATDANKATYYKTMLGFYGTYGLVDEAYAKVATLFPGDTTNQNSAIQTIATAVLERDAFPDATIAFSDIDGDGKPDFFAPWATAEQITASGLTLDDDNDGDGKANNLDATPFFAD